MPLTSSVISSNFQLSYPNTTQLTAISLTSAVSLYCSTGLQVLTGIPVPLVPAGAGIALPLFTQAFTHSSSTSTTVDFLTQGIVSICPLIIPTGVAVLPVLLSLALQSNNTQQYKDLIAQAIHTYFLLGGGV